MLAVSDRAKRQLHTYLTKPENGDVDGKCFRIVPTSHKRFLTMEVAQPKSGDKTYRHAGKTVLALPKRLQKVCRYRKLSIDADGKPQLR
jgi:hypothetical protein